VICISLLELLNHVSERHQCCCDSQDPPLYFQLTIIDFQTKSEITEVAEVTGNSIVVGNDSLKGFLSFACLHLFFFFFEGGDYVSLTSEHLEFTTERLGSSLLSSKRGRWVGADIRQPQT